jgi:lysyl-tRNA synthetase, class II
MGNSGAGSEAEASHAALILDEITGEKVSKSELKRRLKARGKIAKKENAKKTVSAEEPESNLSSNVSYIIC